MSPEQLQSRLINAYKDLLENGKDSALVMRDIVDYSGIMQPRDATNYEPNELLIMEGRRQMAIHMIKHIDCDPRQLLEIANDAAVTNNTMSEGYNE